MGMEKLERDLDIVNFINLTKAYRVMQQILFNNSQLMFMNFQRCDVLCAEKFDEAETAHSNTLKLQKKIKNLLKGDFNKYSGRELAKNAIKERLQKFQDKQLKTRDYRTLQGVLVRSFKTLEEKKEEQEVL